MTRGNKNRKDKYSHIKGKIDYKDENPFKTLQEEKNAEIEKNRIATPKQQTKDWVS